MLGNHLDLIAFKADMTGGHAIIDDPKRPFDNRGRMDLEIDR